MLHSFDLLECDANTEKKGEDMSCFLLGITRVDHRWRSHSRYGASGVADKVL
jgi:hypothetical protein